jgi:aspartyl-tRNA(Asn)/glutamyl-tRNA(Gln) amidotransferase subunit C
VEITREQVEAVAELAKLKLSDDEITLYAEQINSILEYVAQLDELDTSDVPPTASVLPLKNVLRPDTPTPPLAPATAVKNAADAEAEQFKVRAVLDNN